MEGSNMDARKQEVQEALKKATASRKAFLQRNPDFVRKDEWETITPPPTTVEASKRASKTEKKKKKVDPDAAAHDWHQRQLLQDDF